MSSYNNIWIYGCPYRAFDRYENKGGKIMRKKRCAICIMALSIFGLGMSAGIVMTKKAMEVAI